MRPDTAIVLKDILIACFFGTWIILGIGGFFLFHLRREVAFKRKWFPRYIVLVGVLFVSFSTAITVLSSRSLGSLRMLVLVVPAVCLISWLNIRFTKFCGKCGSTVYNQNGFSLMAFCSRCGAKLDSKSSNDLLD